MLNMFEYLPKHEIQVAKHLYLLNLDSGFVAEFLQQW